MNWRNWWKQTSGKQPQTQPETLLGYLLEPRMVFDGAVVATTVEVASDTGSSIQAEAASDAHVDSAGTGDATTTDADHGSSLYVAAAVGPDASPHEATSVADGKAVVFVDTSVSNYQSLLDELPSDIEVVLLDGSQDGLSQMADWAQSHTGYDSIHIISHGTEGSLTLGSTQLTSQSLSTHSGELQTLGQALTTEGDILLYGCDVASGTVGQQFITELAALTGADVAASSDDTGAASRGGDWTLEFHQGGVESTSLAAPCYQGLLGTPSDEHYDENVGANVAGSSFTLDGLTYTITNMSGDSLFLNDGASLGDNGTDYYLSMVCNPGAGSVTIASADGSSFKLASLSYDLRADGNITITPYFGAAAGTPITLTANGNYVTAQNGSMSTDFSLITSFTISGQGLEVNLDDLNFEPAAPIINSITSSTTVGSYNAGDVIFVQVNFSEAVDVTGTPQLTLETGSTDRVIDYVSGSGSSVLTFSYTVQAGDTSADLDALSLALNGGSIKGTSVDHFDANLSLPAGSLANNEAIVIDTTAPNAPSVPDLTSASDLGSSNSDNLTSDTTPTVTGTAEASATVTLYDTNGTTVLGTATADGSGNWSITSSVLSAGVHTLTAKAADGAGNVSSASSGLSITIDATAPTAPSAPDLSAASDSGSSSTDNLTNDTTPTLTGTAEVGSAVTLYDTNGTTVLATATADGSGNWSITSSVLSAGVHTLTAKAADGAGNVSSASSGLSITIDATAPTAPSAPDLSAASDSGSSSTDNLTSNNTPTLTGTAEVGSTVTLYDTNGTTVLGTATADGSGNWSITSSVLGDGGHTLTTKATDGAGNVSGTSAALTLTIDTSISAPSAPNLTSASDSGASNTDNLTNATTPILTGTTEVGSTVTLYDTNGTTVLGTTTADGSGNWSITSSALSAGAHTLTAKATDGAGNVSSASSGLSITIDATAPTAPSAPDLSAASDSGSSSTDNLTNDTTPTLTGTAEVGSTVTLYDTNGTTVLGTATADGSGNWSITSSVLSAGVHTLTAKAADGAGNVSSASSGLSITIDATAPTAPSAPDLSAASDSGSSSTDNLTSNNTPTLTGTAEVGSTVTLYDTNGTTVLGTATADGSGNWSITSSVLGDGGHTLTTKATDGAGNVSSASSALSVTIDATAPAAPSAPDLSAASDLGSSSTDNLTNDTTPTLTGTAEANATVTLYDTDGSTAVGTTTADGSGNWSITSSALSAGAHTLTAKATDGAGNVSSASSALSVTIDATAPAAPSAPDLSVSSDSGSLNSDNLTSDTTPTLTGTAEVGSTVTLYDTNGTTVLGTATADGSGNWSITSSVLSAGVHTLTTKATDGAGNVSSASSGLSITIDATAPTAPSAPDLSAASDSGSSSTDNLTSNNTPTLTGTAEVGSTVTLYDTDGTTVLGTTTADGSGNWSITSSALSAGAHTLTAKAMDGAGNVSSASSGLSLILDTAAPAAPSAPDLTAASDLGSSNSDNLTNDTTPTLIGTAEAGSTVTLYEGATVLGTATADGSGNWSFTSSALGDGDHTLTATQTDVAGNVSAASTALTITIDATPPAVASAPDLDAASDSGLNTDNLTSDNTPTLTGTAEASATVTLYDTDGVTVLGSTTADGSGSWSITSSTLSAGAHTLTTKATDGSGNVSSASSGLSITIDATAPTAPSVPDLSAASDSGSSSTDNLTSNNTPTLTGTAEVGSTVTLYDTDGTTVLGTTTADGSGNWSITSSALSAGAHTLTAKAMDGAGNVSSASSGLSLILDTAAPAAPSVPDLSAASDLGSSSTDNLTNDTTPTLTGTAEANATVTLYDTDGSTALGTTTADGSGNWSITSSALGDGAHSLTVRATDGAGNVSVASATLVLTIDTQLPGSASGSLSILEGSDPGSAVGTVTATDGSSYALIDDAGGRFTIDGATGAVTVADASLLDFESATSHSITVQVTDAAGNTRNTALLVTVTDSSNEAAPVISSNGGGATATVSLLEGATSVTTVAASDADAGSTLSYSIAGGGDGARFTIDPVTGALSFVAAPDFETPADSNTDNSYSVTVQVSDGLRTDSQTITVNVGNSNDAPTVNTPGSIGVTEDVVTAVTGISFSDVDAGSNSVTVTLAAGSGALTAISGSGVTIAGSGSSTLVLTGSVANINSFIAGSLVGFTTAANSSSDVTLDVTINDGGNSGSGGAQSAHSAVTLDVSAVNDAPAIVAPGSIAITEDVTSALTGISFADVDAGSNLVTVTLAVNVGTLAAVTGSGVTVGGSATALTLSGTISDINSFINANKVSFTTASNASSNVTLTTSINDGGNSGSGGSRSDSETTTLTVSAVNDAPVNQLPVSQFIAQDATLIFNSANGNPITISDVDAGAAVLQVTLTASHGVISLPSSTGLSFSVGDGSGDQTMTFSGSAADINTALNGLSFTPTNGFSGSATLNVVTHDLGSSGSGGPQSDSDSLTITVNHSPTANPISAQSALEDSNFSFVLPANTFSDVDVGDTLTLRATRADGSALPSWLSFNASTGTFSGTPENGDVGSISVRVTATDPTGALVSSNFTLNVANTNDAPVSHGIAGQNTSEDAALSFTVPANTFSDVDVGDTLTLSATRADGSALPSWLSFNASTGTFSGTPENGDVGSISVRVTATDPAGALVSSNFTLNVANTNDAPVSHGIAGQNASEDAAFSFTLPANTFSDVDVGNTLTFSATQADGSALPSWLSFNASTGTFSGTPENGDVGSISVRVTATDPAGALVSSNFMLNVANTNDAPVSHGIAGQNASEDTAFSFTLPANTFSDVDVGNTLTLSATRADGSALPSWLSFNASTGTFSGTPENGDVGSISVRVTATDPAGALVSSNFTLNVANTNDAPVSHGIAGQNASEDTTFSFTLPANTFSDVDVGNTLTLSATRADGSALPSWLSFNASTGTFSGTPENGDVGSISVRVTATDPAGALVSSNFTLNVANTNDAPVSHGIAGQNAREDAAFSFTLPSNTFSDVDVGDALTLSATQADGSALPSWLSFNASTGTFSGTPENGDVGSVSVRVTATDATGALVSSNFTLNVANTNDAPVSHGIAGQNASEDAAFSFTLPANTFSDVDVGNTLTLSATQADGSALPSWLSFNASTGTFSGTPENGDVGSISVRVTATDPAGALVSSNFMLNVANTNDAPMSNVIPDQMANAGSAFSFELPAATFVDVDDGDTSILNATLADGSALPSWLSFDVESGTFSGSPTNRDISTLQLQVTVMDSQGAMASTQFQLVVAPSTLPGGDPEFKVNDGATSLDSLDGESSPTSPTTGSTSAELLAPAPLLAGDLGGELLATAIFANQSQGGSPGASLLASLFQSGSSPLPESTSWAVQHRVPAMQGDHSTLGRVFNTSPLDYGPQLEIFASGSWHNVLADTAAGPGYPLAALSLQQQLDAMAQDPTHLIDAIISTSKPVAQQPG